MIIDIYKKKYGLEDSLCQIFFYKYKLGSLRFSKKQKTFMKTIKLYFDAIVLVNHG